MIEEKKKKREQRILIISEELFLLKGYSKTSMKDIAQRSDLGVGTLYNYFRTKGDILVEILCLKINESVDPKISRILEAEKYSLNTIFKLIEIYVNFYETIDVELWRNFLSENMSAKYDFSIKGYFRTHRSLISGLEQVLESLVNEKTIKNDCNIEAALTVIHSIVFMNLSFYVISNIAVHDVMEKISEQLKVLFSGIVI